MLLKKKSCYLLIMCIFLGFYGNAQELSSDELFLKARNEAFKNDDYPKAIELSKKALKKSPGYEDIRIFLGRIYTWSDQLDKAREAFQIVLNQSPDNEEASVAYANLEFWNDDSKKALTIIESALTHHPDSVDLLLYQSRLLNDLRKWEAAEQVVNRVLELQPKNTKARALSVKIRNNSSKNEIGIAYEYTHFDDRFSRDPWHQTSIDYARQTRIGTVIARVNRANRFESEGYQYEIDAYPSISENFRAYASVGYSNFSIFPDYRAGFSLYADLPKSFEADAGFRYLNFGSDTWIYTGAIGKYYSSYWFNLRTYLTPSDSGDLSRSLSFTTRYYIGGQGDFLGFRVSTGLSPDDSQNAIAIGQNNTLAAHNFTINYRKTIKTFNIISVNIGAETQEIREGNWANQYEFGISYARRFK